MNRLTCALVLFFVFAGSATLAYAEGQTIFPNQDLQELTLIATDPESGSFSFMDRSGGVQQGFVGDFVARQEVTVIEVQDLAVVAATYEEYDLYGSTAIRTNLQTIPKARNLGGGKGVR
jgi:hypothetical protein